MISKIKEWVKKHHGFLTERGKLVSWTRLHMLGLGIFMMTFMITSYMVNGLGLFTYTIFAFDMGLLYTFFYSCRDEAPNRWIKIHKGHVHYFIMGHFFTLVVCAAIYLS